ncbi:23S rRNA (pseudouridine(1915)-N(3))-methyltransferase RlmH [Williamsoniiplasma lucivorax]|uniref:Ribosomal RNA large subunit methyltransferase H n=1 Tax=Williamsoniiplasma lucivorax TaxID=209274 RepID=A0A2S5RDP3_9MOLU|nr:23S rRNA (pseudouridine(1915)-N(3))-methyltransferase RlmH [Williamsoniiplasma lucivorax]PPE05245.1 rRNA large subunit methyltransferase [Williamsoniiplasma lucivorax]
MNINIICFGKMDDKNSLALLLNYQNKIKFYSKLNFVELKEEINLDLKSAQVKNEKLLEEKLNNFKNTTIILADIQGVDVTSEQLAKMIETNKDFQGANLTFIIGPSDGFSDEFKNKYPHKISFGKITLPHQLFRIILLEQIFRSFKIINHEKYHK